MLVFIVVTRYNKANQWIATLRAAHHCWRRYAFEIDMREILSILLIIFSFVGCSTEPTFTNTIVYSSSANNQIWKEALVVNILSKTPELNSHRMNGEIENEVYIRDDGTEIVVNASKDMVTNPENKGSFNYYHPVNRPIAHYMADIKPWIVYGNDREDSTTKSQRLDAYSQDLAIGVALALSEREIRLDIENLQYGSSEEMAEARKWVKAFTSNTSDSVFKLYENNVNITYDQALKITKVTIGRLP